MTMYTSMESKYVTTFMIFLSFTAFGLLATVTASTLLDLSEIFQCNSEEISIGLSVRAISYSVAALTCGWLFNHVHRRIGIIIALAASAVTTFPVPLLKSLNYYIFTQAVAGFSFSAIDVAASAWILQLWPGERANTFMQSLHFCFSIGDAITPLIVRPYLSERSNMTMANIMNNHTLSDQTDTSQKGSNMIHIPYIIVSCITIFVAFILMFWHFYEECHKEETFPSPTVASSSVVMHEKHEMNGVRIGESELKANSVDKEGRTTSSSVPSADQRNNNEKEEDDTKNKDKNSNMNDKDQSPEGKGYTIGLLLLGCCLLTFYAGLEFNTLNFLPTFAVFCGARFSKSDGAYMLSIMSVANSLTRAAGIFISTKISAANMIYANMTLLMTGNVMLFLFSATNQQIVWIAIVIIGIGNGSTMPALFAFLSDKMTTSNSIIGIFTFARSAAQSLFALVTGYFIESRPLVFVDVNICSGIVCCLILLIFNLMKTGKSFDVK